MVAYKTMGEDHWSGFEGSFGPGPNGHLQVSHENGAPGCLRFRRDYTTQLCGDYHKPYLKI